MKSSPKWKAIDMLGPFFFIWPQLKHLLYC